MLVGILGGMAFKPYYMTDNTLLSELNHISAEAVRFSGVWGLADFPWFTWVVTGPGIHPLRHGRTRSDGLYPSSDGFHPRSGLKRRAHLAMEEQTLEVPDSSRRRALLCGSPHLVCTCCSDASHKHCHNLEALVSVQAYAISANLASIPRLGAMSCGRDIWCLGAALLTASLLPKDLFDSHAIQPDREPRVRPQGWLLRHV